MEEIKILDELLKEERITKEEYEKLYVDVQIRKSVIEEKEKTKKTKKEKKDKKDKEFNTKKEVKLIMKNKISKLKYKEIKEEKIIHKVDKNFETLNIDLKAVAQFIDIEGTKGNTIKIETKYILDDYDKEYMYLVKEDNNINLQFADKVCEESYFSMTIKVPIKILKTYNINAENSSLFIKKLKAENLNCNIKSSDICLDKNEINNVTLDVDDCRLAINKLKNDKFNINLKKSNIKFSDITFEDLLIKGNSSKLKINKIIGDNLNMELDGCNTKVNSPEVYNFNYKSNLSSGSINSILNDNYKINIKDMFSKISYNKKSYENIEYKNGITTLEYKNAKSTKERELNCDIVSSTLKIS